MYVVNDFNPRTPQGGATGLTLFAEHRSLFQSTHPARGCDADHTKTAGECRLFQSTHPARGCDDKFERQKAYIRKISIHAPREGVRLPQKFL